MAIYTIYIFYIYTWRAHRGWWSCPTSQIFFSVNSLMYMLSIWHSGHYIISTPKWYFWQFLWLKMTFLVTFAQKIQKNGFFWMVVLKKVIFSHKNCQKYHFGVDIMSWPLCQIESIYIREFTEKKICEVGQLHHPLWALQVYI